MALIQVMNTLALSPVLEVIELMLLMTINGCLNPVYESNQFNNEFINQLLQCINYVYEYINEA